MDWSTILGIGGVAASLAGAWLGAYWGYRFQMDLSNRQEAQRVRDHVASAMRFIAAELHDNIEILVRVDGDVIGPSIRSLWAPAAMVASHLRFDAYDAALRDGVIHHFPLGLREEIMFAYQETRKVQAFVRLTELRWYKAFDWYDYDKQQNNPQPLSSPRLVKQQWQDEVRKMTAEALEWAQKAQAKLQEFAYLM